MSQDSATPSSSSKKQDKKNRRAAKVQQKEASGESEQTNEAAVSTPPGASASSDVTSSSKLDKKARRAAKLKEKEQSQDSKESSAPSNKVETGDTKENQQPGPPPDGEKKKLSKAERRELQEAQRKAKLEKKLEATSQPSISSKDSIEKAVTNEITKKSTKITKSSKAHLSSKDNTVHLFSHLPSFKGSLPKTKSYIHPAISQIGLQYATGVVCGGNARAVALLCALKQVVQDYITPDQKELARDLHDQVKRYMEFLDLCRPISVSMDSVSKYISPIILCCSGRTDQQAKQYIVDELERFYKERIQSSDDVISQKALEKINGDDVIITFGHSSVILKVLTEAAKKHPKLSVIIVDSRPKFEGREMLRKLMRSCPSLSCSYVFINSISYVMPLATKVLVGAYAVLANGHVMSRIGTAQVASMAKTYNVPFLVCCETYKFASRMQTDSYVSNELGDSKQLMNINNRAGPLSDIASRPNLHVLNICYDVTPPDYVTGLITETAVIPCTSAPVVIRVKQQYNIVNMKPYA